MSAPEAFSVSVTQGGTTRTSRIEETTVLDALVEAWRAGLISNWDSAVIIVKRIEKEESNGHQNRE